MPYQLYWGDLHNHCSISYGHGTVDQALARAREQLDFCTITGHAFWPDMPRDISRYGEIIKYHHEGFSRLARNWERLLERLSTGSVEGKFVTLPSYEWHSCAYGDHVAYAKGPDLPLTDAPNLPALREVARAAGAILLPHHIGYAAGYRGINWDAFKPEFTPLVEIYSLHGCSESERAPLPMLHDMGPRDAGSTAEAGWEAGHRFGVFASSDHHAAYPGSHGDGRVAVFAKALTREAIWEALLARRVYAATGDKIDARFFVNDAWLGESIQSAKNRHIRLSVQGWDALDKVEVLKNGRVLRRFAPTAFAAAEAKGPYRLRLAWGWGPRKDRVRWQGSLSIDAGRILRADSAFSGAAIVSPQKDQGDAETSDDEDLPHAIETRSERRVTWRSVTTGNLSMRHALVQELSLEVDAPLSAKVSVEVNGQRHEHTLSELLGGGRSHFLRGWLTEAIRIGPLAPIQECRVDAEFDDAPERETDYYRLRAAQHNGQWAWLTPIWCER
jgi:hypothetical protein